MINVMKRETAVVASILVTSFVGLANVAITTYPEIPESEIDSVEIAEETPELVQKVVPDVVQPQVPGETVWEQEPEEFATYLPYCEQEDDNMCYWDATRQGNGTGRSFVTIDNTPYYLP